MASTIPSSEELAEAKAILEASRDQLLAFCAGLSPADWAKSDGDSRWSIAQILEHLVIVERRSVALLENLAQGTPDPDWEAKTAAKDSILARAAVVEQRISAPAAIHPGPAPDPVYLQRDFRAAREETLALAARPGVPLKHFVRTHPAFGDVTALQSLRLLGYHTQRHLSQMRGCL